MTKTEIEAFISRYNISAVENNKIQVRFFRGHNPSPAEITEIKSAKAEILAYFTEQRNVATRRQAAEKAIPGLDRLRAAIADNERYEHQFDQMMDDESNDGAFPPRRPTADITDIKAQFPKAAAFIKAENWKFSSNYAKSAAGKRAVNRILDGEDYTQVINGMETEWSKHVHEHVWD